MINARQRHNLSLGLAFLAPNILGFLAFTLIPLVLSLVLAFSNWDLRLHNRFKTETIEFTFLRNFTRLFEHDLFWQYLANTLFLMMSIPFSVAASLGAALLLSRDLPDRRRSMRLIIPVLAVWGAAIGVLVAMGAAFTGIVLLIGGLACGILISGVVAGKTAYRTFFYIPSVTAGVAVYILWTKLYSPHAGPINTAISPALALLATWTNNTPSAVFVVGACLVLLVVIVISERSFNRLRLMWRDGDIGAAAVAPSMFLLFVPALLMQGWWSDMPVIARVAGALMAIALLAHTFLAFRGPDFKSRPMEGVGTGMVFSLAVFVAQLVLIGLAKVVAQLPAMASDGALAPPAWLADYHWAKPAMMFMAFWAAVGSNNMLLYLAALTNIPQELYEAADIDGASRFQRFWNVTWPQLAPTTFFIVVMGCIGGLQGGFEMARAMTAGGPAGSTTVLSYYIYSEGFVTGRLGYASAIAWVLFALILVITLVNWRFGNRYVNE